MRRFLSRRAWAGTCCLAPGVLAPLSGAGGRRAARPKPRWPPPGDCFRKASTPKPRRPFARCCRPKHAVAAALGVGPLSGGGRPARAGRGDAGRGRQEAPRRPPRCRPSWPGWRSVRGDYARPPRSRPPRRSSSTARSAAWPTGCGPRSLRRRRQTGRSQRRLSAAGQDYQRRRGQGSAKRLRWIGLAAAQFARWNRLSDQFSFLVNEFYPDLLAADADVAGRPTTRRAGCMPKSTTRPTPPRSSRRRWRSNPNAAEVHVALGQLALDDFEIGAAQAACRSGAGNQSAVARRLALAGRHPPGQFRAAQARRRADRRAQAASHFGGDAGPAGRGLCLDRRRLRTAARDALRQARGRSHRAQSACRACSTRRWPTRSTDCAAGRRRPRTIRKPIDADAAVDRAAPASWA